MENLVNKFWRIWTSKYSLFVYEFKTLDFYFSWFFFTLRLFQSFNCEKNPHLHWVTENYILIRYFVNWYRMLRGYTVSNTCLLFPDSSLILDPPPSYCSFVGVHISVPFSEINIKMTFILGHSYFKGIYSVYVEDGLCITLMDSKGQLLLNELSN